MILSIFYYFPCGCRILTAFSGSCPEGYDPAWPIFIASSFAFPLCLAVVLGIWRGGKALLHSCGDHHDGYDSVAGGGGGASPGSSSKDVPVPMAIGLRTADGQPADEETINLEARIKRSCRRLVSGHHTTGKVLVSDNYKTKLHYTLHYTII